jgi:hypothetical protein
VNWGDGTTNNWSPFQESGEYYTENHTWYIPINYTIIAQAKDKYGAESEWSTFEIIIPRNRIIVFWYEKIIERFPLILKVYQKFIDIME